VAFAARHGSVPCPVAKVKLGAFILHNALYALAFLWGGICGDGGTATVVCGQARFRELWTGAIYQAIA
jgi:hypothetical protein